MGGLLARSQDREFPPLYTWSFSHLAPASWDSYGATWWVLRLSTPVLAFADLRRLRREGPAKKKSTDPPVHFLNLRPTHPPSDFFFLTFFFSTFLGVSRQGEFKNTIKIFLQKVHVENFFQNFDKKFRCQFFLDFFCFIAFSGVSQRWEFKNTTKNVLQKKSCRKVFTKNSTKNPKPTFSRFFFYHVFGRFSMRGVQKNDKKNIEEINLTLVLFRTLTHPPTTGVNDFFFIGGPLDWTGGQQPGFSSLNS